MSRLIAPKMSLVRIAALVLPVLLVSGCGQKDSSPERLVSEARQEREKGNLSAAVIHLKNVLQQSPDNAEARYLLGATYMEAGNLALAETDLQRALDLGYDQTKVMPTLGKTLLRMGEFQKVLDKIQLQGQTGNQAQAEILTLHALAALGLNRRDQGREFLEQALARQPEFPDALLAQARLAAAEKKVDEAEKLIERALASSPKNVEALMLKGDLARSKADQAGAIAAYEKILEFSPQSQIAHLSIASIQVEGGKYDEAGKHLDQVRKISPGNPMTHYMQGLIELRKRNFAAARDQVLQVLKVAPNHMPSVLLAGTVEAELGSHNQAQMYLGQVIAKSPENLYARKQLVVSLAKSGRLPRALEVLQPGLQQAPEDPGLQALAGDIYLQSNDYVKARQYFDKAAALDPKSAGPRTGLALSRLGIGETDRALSDLESAVQLDPEKFQADVMLVMWHLQRSNYDQALKALASLEKKQPDNPLTYNLKASVYSAKKDIPAARKMLEKALQLQPTYVPAAVNMAQLDLQEKNSKAARQRLEAVLEKDKNNVQAMLALANLAPRIGATSKDVIAWLERAVAASPGALQPQLILARAHAREGDFKKALEVAQKGMANSPDNPEGLDTLGSIQMASGDKVQAVATFEKLVKAQPDSPTALFRLATVQASGNDQASALRTLKRALTLKPDFQEAQAAVVELELRAGRPAEALKVAQQVQKQVAKSPLGYALEGDTRMAEKNYAQALKSYETAYGLGKSSVLLTKLHAAGAAGGKRAEADARLAQRLKEAPDDVTVRMYLADLGIKEGNYKRSIEHYEQLLAKQPENVVVLNNLAWSYQQVKDARAVETAERAYKLKPDSPDIADTLGWMLVEQGNTTRGLELLQKAATAAPQSQTIRFHLAQTYLKTGDKTKARLELERIQSNGAPFPQQAEAASLLKQLK